MKISTIILTEFKQVGLLYHYTSVKKLYSIKECNCLRGSMEPVPGREVTATRSISTTRNKNLHKLHYFFNLGIGPSSSKDFLLRLTLDGDLISNRYKIVPYSHFLDKENKYKDEYEERILTPLLTDLDKYLIDVKDVTSEVNYQELPAEDDNYFY
jgi:hypothetical protein